MARRGLGALTLGNEILRLRRWLATERLSTELHGQVKRIIDAFTTFFSKPQHSVAELKGRMQEITRLDPGRGEQERRSWARIVGALRKWMFTWIIIRDSPRLNPSV